MEKSCGAVLFTEGAQRQFVLVKSGANGTWGLPKGHVEANETERETALREIAEETGVLATLLDGFRGEVEYVMGNGVRKRVVYFAASYANQRLQKAPGEIGDIKLLPLGEALEFIWHDDIRKVLTDADEWISAKSK